MEVPAADSNVRNADVPPEAAAEQPAAAAGGSGDADAVSSNSSSSEEEDDVAMSEAEGDSSADEDEGAAHTSARGRCGQFVWPCPREYPSQLDEREAEPKLIESRAPRCRRIHRRRSARSIKSWS
eukprot:6616202-Pyramimonas_sp.AAC.1